MKDRLLGIGVAPNINPGVSLHKISSTGEIVPIAQSADGKALVKLGKGDQIVGTRNNNNFPVFRIERVSYSPSPKARPRTSTGVFFEGGITVFKRKSLPISDTGVILYTPHNNTS